MRERGPGALAGDRGDGGAGHGADGTAGAVRLETHLWMAKRMAMGAVWGHVRAQRRVGVAKPLDPGDTGRRYRSGTVPLFSTGSGPYS